MSKKSIYFFSSVVLAYVISSAVAVSGCSPEMRRKFIREKKPDTDQNVVIPVLDPIEYSNTLETSRARYDYFYALLKVWQKDVLMLIDDGASDKQVYYALGQVKFQLQELSKILDGLSQKTALDGIKHVDDILAQYDRPAGLRNAGIIRRDVQRLGDTVIRPLSSDVIFKDSK